MNQTIQTRWGWWIGGLCVAWFFARGVLLLCILPPQEGWDEYQHVARLEYLCQEGRHPVYGQATVPASLMRHLLEMPMSEAQAAQMAEQHALTYAQYFRTSHRPTYRPEHPVGLYQAQHSPWYYVIARPVYVACGGAEHLRTSMAALRLLNLVFLTAALAFQLAATGRLLPRGWMYVAVPVTAAVMFTIAGLRVSNDALATLLVSAGIYVVAELVVRASEAAQALSGRWFVGAAVAGALFGAGAAVRMNQAVFVPLLPALLLWGILRGWISWRAAAAGVAVYALPVMATLLPGVIENRRIYGTATVSQETVILAQRGVGADKYLPAVRAINWQREIRDWWTIGSLWIGSWSFLQAPGIRKPYKIILAIGFIAGVILALLAGRRPGGLDREVRRSLLVAALTVVLSTLGLCHHAVLTQLCWNAPITNAWYVASAFPLFYLLLLAPLDGIMRWFSAVLSLFLLGAGAYGTLVIMPRYYADATAWPEIARRLASLQPLWLGTPTLLAALGVSTLLAGLAIVVTYGRSPAGECVHSEALVERKKEPRG